MSCAFLLVLFITIDSSAELCGVLVIRFNAICACRRWESHVDTIPHRRIEFIAIVILITVLIIALFLFIFCFVFVWDGGVSGR